MSKDSLEYPVLKNTSVVDSVKDFIVDQLIKGNLRPGDKLPTEAEFCANLNAGRNSVREAIKQLEAQGVVYIKRAEGTYISDSYDPKMLSPVLYSLIMQQSNWRDFVDLRKTLDIGSLYVVAEKGISEGGKVKLKAALDRLESCISESNPDPRKINDADCNFHTIITELTENPQLKTICDFINQLTIPSRIETTAMVVASGDIKDYGRLHRQLYDIIVNSNKSEIENAVVNHYVFWEKRNS